MLSNRKILCSYILFEVLCVLTGCHSEKDSIQGVPPPSTNRGRVIYQTQCIACHNPNPHKPGSIGPDVFGSSKELIEARVLRGEYPPSYQPKRQSHTMAPLPHLKNELDSIYLYLNQADSH